MRGAGDNETGFGVTAERLLQNASEFALPIGDVRGLAISEGVDDLAQSSQTSIDLLGLIEQLALCASFGNLLTASQINEIKFAGLGTEICGIVLADGEDEDHVRA